MEPAGLKAFERGKKYPTSDESAPKLQELELPPEIEREIRKNKRAWANYCALAPSYRKKYAAWLIKAKLPETLEKRLRETIERLEKNLKPGMG